MYKGSFFYTLSSAFVVLMTAILTRMSCELYVILSFIFLMMGNMEQLFIFLLIVLHLLKTALIGPGLFDFLLAFRVLDTSVF